MSKEGKYSEISPRVSLFQNEDTFSIVILPSDKQWKVIVLFIWMFLWTLSGIIVFTQYFSSDSRDMKIAIIIWLGFWSYFEFKIGRAFLFRKFGKEKLWLKGGKMFYLREIFKRGKVQEFDIELIRGIKLIDIKKSDFFQQVNESFWVIGGERISFEYGSKEIKFGIQLTEEETKKIFKDLKRVLGR